MHRPFLDPIFFVISSTGLGQVQAILAIIVSCFARTRAEGLRMLAAIIVGGIPIAGLFKLIFDRDRPSNLSFARPQESIFHHSFPSGHTTSSFALATMILLLTWSTRFRWVGPVAIVWAALVGFSRVYRGVHWPTDVFAGAFAGIFAACLVFLWLKPGTVPSVETSHTALS